MGLEFVDYIGELNQKHPLGRDFRREGSAHLRNLKKAAKQSLPCRIESASNSPGALATIKDTGAELPTFGRPILVASSNYYSGTSFSTDSNRPSFRIDGGLGSLASHWWDDYFEFSPSSLRNGNYLFVTHVTSLKIPADSGHPYLRFVAYLDNVPYAFDITETSPVALEEVPAGKQIFSRDCVYSSSPDLVTLDFPPFSFAVPLLFNEDYVIANGKKFSTEEVSGYGLGIHFQIESREDANNFAFEAIPVVVEELIMAHYLLEIS